MDRTLNVLAPTRYLWDFNGPKDSRHRIDRRPFMPLNKVNRRYEGVTFFRPLPLRRFDLIHAFNRIPVGVTPYLIGFESHLPRAFWFEDSAYYRRLVRSLEGDRCRGIIAISKHAEGIFLDTHSNKPGFDVLKDKLKVRLPNMRMPETGDELEADDLEEVRIAFVGSHFARKGGCVAVRMAQMAIEQGFPLKVDVVSRLECGVGVWTDPTDSSFFTPYLKGLSSPNIRFRKGAPNAEVLDLMRRSHFSLLTTFSDTFGFSAIESMASFTPVIGTRQGALGEFICDGENGLLLELPVTSRGEWVYSAYAHRDSRSFEKIYRDEVERMAEEALAAVQTLHAEPERYRVMRREARRTAEAKFNHVDAREFWDGLYEASQTKRGRTLGPPAAAKQTAFSIGNSS